MDPRDMDEATYRLFQFFAGYFNQDWHCDHPTWQDVVRSFGNDVSDAEPLEIAADIDRMLIALPDDEKLGKRLYPELGCYYLPRPDLGGPTVREWLGQVAEILRSPK